ncbi:hypothetical protein GUITHDRAFT_147870 [Guillardia theta CCMP2712]|uniref:C-type lectin domain-containing protein n=1 Tax=Guillardia theta (strain CCMP2712) TaxID=905079 RepID=L1ICE5_GUITC|nr:hypothetical protein GUITHDRAFT_147870 [Guillardia theta CCMP2712]EKX33510.1 hypothetical protein GUITHDRAFT_147870 [Guillardia theta CCMP2712]|eukprot:XP_005820490.1 hypothetical protein GUITHDRAFT_147870 [Guillardia theta CCMP2712]
MTATAINIHQASPDSQYFSIVGGQFGQLSMATVYTESNEDKEPQPMSCMTFLCKFYSPKNIYNKFREHIEKSDEYAPFFAQPQDCDGAYSRRERFLVFVNSTVVVFAVSAFIVSMEQRQQTLPPGFSYLMSALLSQIFQFIMFNPIIKKLLELKMDRKGACGICLKASILLAILVFYSLSIALGVLFIVSSLHCNAYDFANPAAASPALLAPSSSSNSSSAPSRIVYVCASKNFTNAGDYCRQLGGRLPTLEEEKEKEEEEVFAYLKDQKYKTSTFGNTCWTGKKTVLDKPDPGFGCVTANYFRNPLVTTVGLNEDEMCSIVYPFVCQVTGLSKESEEVLGSCSCVFNTKEVIVSLILTYLAGFIGGNKLGYLRTMIFAPLVFLVQQQKRKRSIFDPMRCLLNNPIFCSIRLACVADWGRADASGMPAVSGSEEWQGFFFSPFFCYDEPTNLCFCSSADREEKEKVKEVEP